MKLILFVGPTGSGKNTLIKKLLEEDKYKYVTSSTTRSMRENETQGNPYNFISKEDFLDKLNKGELIEHEEIHGNYYGLSKNTIDDISKDENNIYLKDIGVEGAVTLKEMYGEKVIFIFIDVIGDYEIEKRLLNRGDSDTDIAIRLERLKYEREYKKSSDYSLLNIDLMDCFNDIKVYLDSTTKGL